MNLKRETLYFESVNAFDLWLKETERISKTCFVKKKSDPIKTNSDTVIKTSHLHCSRSGVFNSKPSKETRKRELKIQGTRKINGYCPCGIRVTYFNDGKVTAVYCPSNVGLKTDLAHLNLSLEERKRIASSMASKIPFDVILDNVRCTVNKQELDRVHLLTKQDLYNIESEFGLDETVRHKNDAVSVDAWVQEENMSAKSCVLLYKPQNEVVEQYTTFKKEDFALGIMTPAEEEMLRKFGSDCVCVDGTHGLNSYDFEVVTLMVIDDMRQGFPCAFFICSRIDSETVGTFFSFIKERLGDQLKPTVFMSDMADLFYNGWLPVMGPVEKTPLLYKARGQGLANKPD
ncbi:uncharacterized protein LOC124374051 [Homalodisca vitripennis]|uniref:uncharacterized protein LOC124374051 n=1 Tax=Homalodisca vitripennis TaxID=197043 RepID=UPI001EEADEDE|nr:uncharacterized protein LOC124374051 [Homalodisca vitripennis]